MSVMEEHRARTRRSFTDDFKRDAVAMVLDDGYKGYSQISPKPTFESPYSSVVSRSRALERSMAVGRV
jgi:transposase-like protein